MTRGPDDTIDTQRAETFAQKVLAASALDEDEIADRVLTRLRRKGPECLSHLAVELAVSPKAMLAVLRALRGHGKVEVKPHRDLGDRLKCDYEAPGTAIGEDAGELRWRAVY